jgi:hypothetical protein
MDNLKNSELQDLYNNLREELIRVTILVRKIRNEKATPKHLLPSLYKELQEIENRIDEVRAEALNRDLELSEFL